MLSALPLTAGAQPPETVYRIGWLMEIVQPGEALTEGLRDLGWIEGKNLIIERRLVAQRREQLPALITDLLRLKVDVIVVQNTQTALAAKRATQTVPIVFFVGDPVHTGLVTSLTRPGGNLTGVANQLPELRRKSLQLLLEVVPKASQIGFLSTPANPAGLSRSWRELEAAARVLGVKMRRFDIMEPRDLDRAFATMRRDRLDGLIVPLDPIFISDRRRLVDLAGEHRLPVLYPRRDFVEAGGLMSYSIPQDELTRRVVARYVDRILRGAKPADLPIEQPTQFEFIINLKTAKTLGLTIPQSLLARADHVIE
jgi:putative ABC transport system substrate-binding protein